MQKESLEQPTYCFLYLKQKYNEPSSDYNACTYDAYEHCQRRVISPPDTPGIFENVYILKIDSLRGIRRILGFDPGVTVFLPDTVLFSPHRHTNIAV